MPWSDAGLAKASVIRGGNIPHHISIPLFHGVPRKISSRTVTPVRRASNASCTRSRDPVLDTKGCDHGHRPSLGLRRSASRVRTADAAACFGVDADEVLTPHLWLSVWRMHDRFCHRCSGVVTGLLVRHRPCGSRVGSRALVIRFRCGATPHSGVQQRPSRRGRGAAPAAGSGVRWDRRR